MGCPDRELPARSSADFTTDWTVVGTQATEIWQDTERSRRRDIAAPCRRERRSTPKTTLFPKRAIWIAMAVSMAAVLAFGVVFQLLNGSGPTSNAQNSSATTFVGSETCAGCHQAEAKLWNASQHKAAMQHATDKTVLGNFNDASFDYYGVHSRFFRKDGKFLVETDGPDGKLAVFEVKYTFGVDPLQQYLVEFPDGRLQALSLAWDSRPQDKGGQRWFHLSPNEEIRHDDILHWTKLNQNWNFMCAECHSTGLRKNYDAKTDRFATTWAEISVGCEACHGQGSASRRLGARSAELVAVRQARGSEQGTAGSFRRASRRRLADRSADRKRHDARAAPATLRKEVETCGLCHARRAGFHEDWVPGQSLSQTHVVEALARTTYHADGQIRDVEEPYNYTPFKQGKMFAAGVTCSDCHEPHSAKLRASGEGVCLQCHASGQICRREASPPRRASIRRRPASPATCRPAPTWSSIRGTITPFASRGPIFRSRWERRTHATIATATSRRNGRPTAVEQWFGPDRKGFQTYGAAFHAARTDQADAAALLGVLAADKNAPAVARASALGELASRVSPANIATARNGPCRSRSDGADRRARHAGKRARRPDLAAGLAAARRSRARRPDQGGLPARVRSDRKPAAAGSRALRSGGEGVHRRAARQRRAAGSPHHARRISSPSADRPPMPRPNTRPRCASARNMRRRRSISPTSTGNSAATATAKPCCAPRLRRHRATRPRITRSA